MNRNSAIRRISFEDLMDIVASIVNNMALYTGKLLRADLKHSTTHKRRNNCLR